MKLSYLTIICIALIAFCTQSCTNMNDLHQKYLDEGEIIYAARIDSVHVFAGRNRLQLEMFIGSQRIDSVRVYWNNYTDSLTIGVKNQTGVINKFINDMPETDYVFNLVSFDKFGNKSLPVEKAGKVYGTNFQNFLLNRVVKKAIIAKGVTTITWSSALDKGLNCDLIYTNTTGAQVTKIVPMSEVSTVLADYASNLTYRTSFLPEATAIDTFYTDYKPVTVTLK